MDNSDKQCDPEIKVGNETQSGYVHAFAQRVGNINVQEQATDCL